MPLRAYRSVGNGLRPAEGYAFQLGSETTRSPAGEFPCYAPQFQTVGLAEDFVFLLCLPRVAGIMQDLTPQHD